MSSDKDNSSDPQSGFILSPSSTAIDLEHTSATVTGADSTAGLDATANGFHVSNGYGSTPKVESFSHTPETSQSLQPPDPTTTSCRDYLYVPVSKVRPCLSDEATGRRVSDHQLSEPKVQSAMAIQSPKGHQKVGCIGTDASLGLFSTEPETLKSALHSIENCPATDLRGILGNEVTAAADKEPEVPHVGTLSDVTQTEQQPDASKGLKTTSNPPDHALGTATVSENRQGSLLPRPDTLPRCEHQNLAPHQTIENPLHVASAPTVLHAPVPISKIRPFFDPPSFKNKHGHHGHSSVSKVRPAPDLTLNEQYDPANTATPKPAKWDKPLSVPAPSPSSQNNQSPGALFDHKRTRQWLKDVLKHPQTYTPKYTRRPGNIDRICNTSPEQDRYSESVLSHLLSTKSHGRSCVPSECTPSKFDRVGFKRAVSDLERLLNEALAIASQVVDQPTSPPPQEQYKQASVDLHSHCRGMPTQTGTIHAASRPSLCSASADGSGGDFGLVVSTIDSDRRALTNTSSMGKSHGLVGRSKLGESVQTTEPNKALDPCESSTGLDEVGNGHRIPRRKSSKKLGKLPIEHKTCANSKAEPAIPIPHGRGRALEPNLSHADNVRNRSLRHAGRSVLRPDYRAHETVRTEEEAELPNRNIAGRPLHIDHGISLHGRSHVSLRGAQGFSLAKSHKRQPVARDWSPSRKRFVASVACISTALIGIILGIYSGIVPSIQYYVIDQSHIIIHGNTACFLGLAIPTFFLWPLPLLHGRKPYILSSLVLAMPLLFPQALAINSQRLTNAVPWRCFLLVARALMGASLGFASMNFHSILTDLFGASLMSCNPHQEVVDQHDARRHGGGMGVWLGIWTWCWIGSLGVGFLVGACVIDSYHPAWGFYISIMVIAVVLMLNVVCPEVRRSPYRRSVAEVRTGEDISRRVARGEIMMHRVKTGPKWWGQEVYHGIALNLEMLRQPGFAVMAVYSAWIYAQVVLIIILLGSLVSRFYRLRSTEVGLFVGVMALGALLAIPFQKANLFSRSRQAQLNSNLATLNRKVAWSSHLVRRTVFTLLLPLAGICYAGVSSGPPIHVSVPTIFTGFVGFLSCLAISECNGLVMEAFDCSDLSPAMTGRQKHGSGRTPKRTNYSSFPRVTAGFASIHSLAFVLAAGSTALGGHVTRTLGQQVSTGVVAGILLVLTFLLLLVLIRFAEIQIVPKSKSQEMDRLVDARRRSTIRRVSMPHDARAVIEEEKAWRPVMIGNPTSKKRRMNIFELGGMTRWQEIRKKNRLIDAGGHLNREAWDQGMGALDDHLSDFRRDAHELFHGKKRSARGLRGTGDSSERGEPIEMRDIERDDAPGATTQSIRQGRRGCALSRTPDGASDGSRDGRARR